MNRLAATIAEAGFAFAHGAEMRSLFGAITTCTFSPSAAGASKPSSPRTKPWAGSSSPSGAVKRNG